MARDLGSIVKRSRREGYALHPKAHKVLVKRTTAPGTTPGGGGRPRKPSQYALQLREKQKVKRLYGLLEKQFVKLVNEALRSKGESGIKLLDNVIYRAGLAVSRPAARQLVSHGHFMLNGRRTDIPSIRLDISDELVLRDSAKTTSYFKNIDELSPAPSATPAWLKVDRKNFKIKLSGQPSRDDAEPDIKEQLIIEFYSR